jgi:hypothetical protein
MRFTFKGNEYRIKLYPYLNEIKVQLKTGEGKHTKYSIEAARGILPPEIMAAIEIYGKLNMDIDIQTYLDKMFSED